MEQRESITLKGYKIEKYEQYLKGDSFEIYKAKNIQTGELITLKEKSKITTIEENLILLQQRVKQQHIIEIKMYEKQEHKAFLIIEKTTKLLNDYIREEEYKRKQQIEKCLLFIQLVQAIQEFHRFGTFHRNLKPINFVFCEDKNNQQVLKLLDFGLVQLQTDKELNKQLEIGSLEYLAPEIVDDHFYDKQVDIWSLGVIWYEMLTGEILIKQNNKQLTQDIIDSSIDQSTNQINPNIKNLLKQMLIIQSSKRITLDILFQNLKMLCQNQEQINILKYSLEQNEQIIELINLKNQIKQQYHQQFKEQQLQICDNIQIQIKKIKIDIIQDEINQFIHQLDNLYQQYKKPYIQQKYAIQEQTNCSNLDRWQKVDKLFYQFDQQLQIQITSLIQQLEEKIQKSQKDKENEIKEEISLQIKQQLLLDYNLKISIKENEILGLPAYFIGQEALQQQIIQVTQYQIEILCKQLDQSSINFQNKQSYQQLKDLLVKITLQKSAQRESPKEEAEKIREFQKQLYKINIDVESIKKEIELEYLSSKFQKENITLINRSNLLLKQYNTTLDDQILRLEELKTLNLLQNIQNQQNNYFNEKIQNLINQKQNLISEFEQLSNFAKDQKIENIIIIIQKIKIFNDKIIQINNHEILSSQQFVTEQLILQTQDLNSLQQELKDLLNLSIHQIGLMEAHLQATELYCTDIEIINNQNQIKNDMFKTLENQSKYLQDCQRILEQNNEIIKSKLDKFDQKGFLNQRYEILSQITYENNKFKLIETIKLLEQVRDRLKFHDDKDFYKEIIDSRNEIKNQKFILQNMLQEVTEIILKSQNNNDEQQKQIKKIKALIIQTQLKLQLIPSFYKIQRFNQEQQDNQTNLTELLTLIVYIKLYHYSRYLKRDQSLKIKSLQKLNQDQSQVQNQAILLKYNQIQNQIESNKQEVQSIKNMMEEYQSCLQQKKQAIENSIVKEHDISITKKSENLEKEIKTKIRVKLNANFSDELLINRILEYQKMFEFSVFLCYNSAMN
ncbi:unnamed protein product [Paramecium sonneborni]|uniref:Protein kinase domain-containing protein n=1 Tax=Paramecium sonneborni TaxID=65129 RepID=A0A8S1NXC5_9CILI|nr:unnamed protein product [Paramecium sonneborni]